MKALNKIWGIGILAVTLSLLAPSKSRAQGGYISDQEFYDGLAPYGTWVSDPQYGNVWIPDADQDFRPYATRGHWVITDYGNTWVSDYEWGWAPFHYGRWEFDDFYNNWIWIPGYEWAPAWVSWRNRESRRRGRCCSWLAAMPPRPSRPACSTPGPLPRPVCSPTLPVPRRQQNTGRRRRFANCGLPASSSLPTVASLCIPSSSRPGGPAWPARVWLRPGSGMPRTSYSHPRP